MKQPHAILPDAVYDLEAARTALGLTKTTLSRELRLGRLRCSKRAGRIYVLGEWLLEWLRAGEVHKSHQMPGTGGAIVYDLPSQTGQASER
jgi:hypothetical protein